MQLTSCAFIRQVSREKPHLHAKKYKHCEHCTHCKHYTIAFIEPERGYSQFTEAHAQDEWPISSPRYHDKVPVIINQPKTNEERLDVAQRFVERYQFQVVVCSPIHVCVEFAIWIHVSYVSVTTLSSLTMHVQVAYGY